MQGVTFGDNPVRILLMAISEYYVRVVFDIWLRVLSLLIACCFCVKWYKDQLIPFWDELDYSSVVQPVEFISFLSHRLSILALQKFPPMNVEANSTGRPPPEDYG